MPYEKVPVQHKFGIISHSQRIELQERLLQQVYAQQANKTGFRASRNPFALDYEFLTAYAAHKDDGNTKKVEQLLSICLKKIQKCVSYDSKKFFDESWGELSVLWHFSKTIQTECEELLLVSLQAIELRFDLMPAFLYVAESAITFFLCKAGESIAVVHSWNLWRILKILEISLENFLICAMRFSLDPFKEDLVAFRKRWLEHVALIQNLNLPPLMRDFHIRAVCYVNFLCGESDEWSESIPPPSLDTSPESLLGKFVSLCKDVASGKGVQVNKRLENLADSLPFILTVASDVEVLLSLRLLQTVVYKNESTLPFLMDYILPLYCTDTSDEDRLKSMSGRQENSPLGRKRMEVLMEICLLSKSIDTRKLCLLHPILGLCEAFKMSTESQLASLHCLESLYIVSQKQESLNLLQTPLWAILSKGRKLKKPADVSFVCELSKTTAAMYLRLIPYYGTRSEWNSAIRRCDVVFQEERGAKAETDYTKTTTIISNAPTRPPDTSKASSRNTEPLKTAQKSAPIIGRIKRELMMPDVYRPTQACPYTERMDKQLFRVVEDQWRTQFHMQVEAELAGHDPRRNKSSQNISSK